VRRYFVLLATLMVLLLACVPRLRALTDEEKKEEFLQARGDESDTSPTPTPSPAPRHLHRRPAQADESASSGETPEESPGETPSHRHHHTVAEQDETPSHRRHHHSPTPEPTVRRHHLQEEEQTPIPLYHPQSPTPSAAQTPIPEGRPVQIPMAQPVQRYEVPVETPIPQATPAPTPAPGPWGAQIDVEKQGLEEQGGFVPPPPSTRHHWWQFFGGESEPDYRYLTPEIREAIDRAPVARRRWRFIVVHNSGTRQGNARIFDYYHRYVRKMPNGLAYHFVIGNGTSSGDGQIEIGNRWVRQLQGGHVHSDYLNNIALGICLVGDFNRDLPTKAQLEALDELIRYLRIRVGKIDGKPAIVKAHKEINPPQWPTDCPGDRFPYRWLHERFD